MKRGWRVTRKCLCIILGLIEDHKFIEKNVFWGILKHKQQVIAYFQTHYDYVPQKMSLKLAV